MAGSNSTRLAALDGLRGWAALSVVVYHMTRETFGVIFPVFYTFPFSFLGNGTVAVAIFFALSGYVLTLRRWHRTDNPNLPLTLLRRYLRLEIPVMAAVLIAWALMSLHLTPTAAANAVVHRDDWMGSFANFEPDFVGALSFALVRTYWLVHDHNYGPFLWTMVIELWGSICVLSISQTPRVFREAYSVLLLLVVLMLMVFPLAACLPAGAILALAQRDGYLFCGEPGPLESFVASAGLLAALLGAAFEQMIVDSYLPAAIVGFLIFLCAARSLPARAFLSAPLSAWLGRISFPVYLMQFAVIITVSAWMIVRVDAAGLLNPWTATLIAIVGTAAVLLAAQLFLPVETFTLSFIKRIGRPRTPQPDAAPDPTA